MTTCLCGNAVEQEGATCARCHALRILGLDPHATRKDIETNYRLLVKVWHPDRFQADPRLRNTAEETLKSINAAYGYLGSTPEVKVRRRPNPNGAAQHAAVQPASRAARRSNSLLGSAILVRCVLLLLGIAIPALVLVGLDDWLSSNPGTAAFYATFRSRLFFTVKSNVAETTQGAERILHRLSPAEAAVIPQTAAAPPSPDHLLDAAASSSTDPRVSAATIRHIPMPYVTVGLSKEEVMTVLGPPASSTDGAMRYRNAVFSLRKGVVVGWTVDPALVPLRVRLWPNAHTDPRLTAFTLGSPNNDVIAVQGTPTTLSENKLVYGGSEVFLEGGRVIGWNDNHGSQRLRVAHR